MSEIHQNFNHRVWKIVANIPVGEIMSYGEIAKAAGFPRYTRLVSRAMSRSPISLPWFRVVKSDRTLAFVENSKTYQEQMQLLKQEGVQFAGKRIVAPPRNDNLDQILWGPQDSQ